MTGHGMTFDFNPDEYRWFQTFFRHAGDVTVQAPVFYGYSGTMLTVIDSECRRCKETLKLFHYAGMSPSLDKYEISIVKCDKRYFYREKTLDCLKSRVESGSMSTSEQSEIWMCQKIMCML